MSTNATYAPLPAAIPTPTRGTDVFDFLHDRREEAKPEPEVRVQEDIILDQVAVTVATPDGRTIRRQVDAEAWQQKEYRGALIRSMCSLIA